MTPKPVATKVHLRPDGPVRFTLNSARKDTTPSPKTHPLCAFVKDQTGDTITDATVVWTSSRDDIATVDASGVVTPHAAGTCSIIATHAIAGAEDIAGRIQCEVTA